MTQTRARTPSAARPRAPRGGWASLLVDCATLPTLFGSAASNAGGRSSLTRSGGLECGYLLGEASWLIVGDEGSAVFDRYEASVGESGVQPSGEVELEETVRGSPH